MTAELHWRRQRGNSSNDISASFGRFRFGLNYHLNILQSERIISKLWWGIFIPKSRPHPPTRGNFGQFGGTTNLQSPKVAAINAKVAAINETDGCLPVFVLRFFLAFTDSGIKKLGWGLWSPGGLTCSTLFEFPDHFSIQTSTPNSKLKDCLDWIDQWSSIFIYIFSWPKLNWW